MEEYLIDNIISPEAEKQLSSLSKTITELASNIESLNNIPKATKDNSSNKEFDSAAKSAAAFEMELKKLQSVREEDYKNILMTRAERQKEIDALKTELGITQKKSQAIRQSTQATQEEIVSKQALNNIKKLNAIATSEEVTELQRLVAQMKLAEIEMQKEFNPSLKQQSQRFTELSGRHAQLQKAYNITSQATGVMGRQMNSAYGSTFQLTQIMRELPNFAISSRIGFMSLSNNLPMLIDSFKLLSEQVDSAGKKLGNIGALKQFAKSLLSLNTIMIVASTLLVLFGDKIVDFAGKLLTGKNMMDDFSDTSRMLIKVIDKQTGVIGTNVLGVEQLGVVIKKYQKTGESANWIIEKTNELFGEQYGKVKNVSDAIALYNKHALDLINWSIKMEAAMGYVKQASDAILLTNSATASISQIKNNFLLNDGEVTYAQGLAQKYINTMIREGKKSGVSAAETMKNLLEKGDVGGTFFSRNIMSEGDEKSALQSIARFTTSLKNAGHQINQDQVESLVFEQMRLLIANARYSKAKEYAEQLMPEQFAKQKANDKESIKSARDIFVAREFYDRERAQMLMDMNRLEEMYNETMLDGTINSYEKRLEAAKRYYFDASYLIAIDRKTALESSDEKTKKELRNIDKINQANLKKFGSSSPEGTKSQEQYNVAKATILENSRLNQLKINDEYNQKELEQEDKFIQTNFKIAQDKYKKDVELLEISEKDKLYLIEKNYKEQQNILKSKGTGEAFMSGVTGYSKDTSIQETKLKYDSKREELNTAIETLNKEKEAAIETQKTIEKSNIESIYRQKKAEIDAQIAVLNIKAKAALSSGDTESYKKYNAESTDLTASESVLESTKNEALAEVDVQSVKTEAILKLEGDLAEKKKQLSRNSAEETAAITQAATEQMAVAQIEMFKNVYSNMKETISAFYDAYYQQLDEQRDYFSEVEEDKLNEIQLKADAGATINEESAKAGLSVSEQAAEEEAKTKAYYASVQKKLDKDEKEAKKKQFLLNQSFTVAEIWLKFAEAQMGFTASASSMGVAAPAWIAAMTAINLATAISSSALAAAQTIPYFKDGGIMEKKGKAVLGDGGISEMVLNPNGEIFFSDNKPTVYDLEKGAKIFPDAAKVDIDNIIGNSNRKIIIKNEDDKLLKEIRMTNTLLKRQKSSVFYGMPLIEQMNSKERINKRKRGLL